MKAKELRDLSAGEIEDKIESLEGERFNLRFQHKLGQLSNPTRLGQVRREIACAKTVLGEMKRAKKSQG